MSDLTLRDKQYIANTYNRFPVEIVRGDGSLAWDADGKRYIDMGSGIAVNSFGFCDAEWQAAVTASLRWYSTPQIFITPLPAHVLQRCSASARG